MLAGVLKETYPGERRVAMVPAVIPQLADLGLEVAVQAGAGEGAGFLDEDYRDQGASLAPSREQLFASADLILEVRSLSASRGAPAPQLDLIRPGHVDVGLLDAVGAPEGVRALAERGAIAFALDLVPRIARAQTMDALSTVAMVIGYEAVLLAAQALPRMFPMLTTATGTVRPARVLVIGGGVAGLQAIATAHHLGAVVEAYDIRLAVKELVESLGIRFVDLRFENDEAEDAAGQAKVMDEAFYRRERENLAPFVSRSDVVIATAAIPGKTAPVLITAEMVDAMRPGSVIVDVAAEQGGNCELSRPGETVVRNRVTILGPVNLAANVPEQASQLYARSVSNFLAICVKAGRLEIDPADEILRHTLVAQGGEVVHPQLRETLGLPPLVPTQQA